MERYTLHRIASALVLAVVIGSSGCGASAENATGGAPSGTYESQLPDGTTMRLNFRDGGSVEIAMTENGETNAFDGQWNLNGESILVQGGEGMVMQFSWKDDALVTDFGGATLTFTET